MTKYLKAVLLGAVMLIASFAGAQVVTSAQGFTVTAPVALTAQPSSNLVDDAGTPYTMTSYTMAPLANGDDFAVVVGQFNFQLDQHNLQGMLDTYEKHTGLSIVKSLPTTVSGQPGYLVASKSTSGRDTRYATLVTYRGNTVYIFVIRTYPETTSDEASFKAFMNPTI